MGSAEGLGGGVLVGEIRWHKEAACSSGGKKAPVSWRKFYDSEVCMEACHQSSLHSDDVVSGRDSRNMNSHPTTLDIYATSVLQKSGKIVRKNSGCTKRSGMTHMEVSKNKSGLHDVNGTVPELASSSARCNVSEKNQLVQQKNSSTSRRGDKRNSKANYKSRCDSFSLKSGLVGFNSAAGGNNFIGICGLKPDVFDITKDVTELSLDELLCGSYSCPFIKDKGKTTTNLNSKLLQSVRSACSILQPQKVSRVQNFAETDNSSFRNDSPGLVAFNSAVGQTDGNKGDCFLADLPSKVHESDDIIKISDFANSPLYKPKDILERLALSRPKDLDVLLSDAARTTSSSKTSTDARLSKSVSQRTGLPPFTWSHSFSGHNRLGSDAVKLSMSRALCQGRWVKVKNCVALHKGCADLLKDFESLTFDQSLVLSTSDRPENEFAQIDRVLSSFDASSPSKIPADECSTTHAAAQTLLDMGDEYSKKNPCAAVKLLKMPSQMAIKTSQSKATDLSEFSFQEPKSTLKSKNPLKVHDDESSSKKPKLSTDVISTNISHAEPATMRKGTLDQCSLLSVKSPPRKLYRDPNANSESYGVNLVKKPCVIKTPRDADRPSSSKPRFWKSSR